MKAASPIDPRERSGLLLRDLRSSRAGLSPREAQRRLDQYGRNEIRRQEGAGHLRALAGQFTHPLAACRAQRGRCEPHPSFAGGRGSRVLGHAVHLRRGRGSGPRPRPRTDPPRLRPGQVMWGRRSHQTDRPQTAELSAPRGRRPPPARRGIAPSTQPDRHHPPCQASAGWQATPSAGHAPGRSSARASPRTPDSHRA